MLSVIPVTCGSDTLEWQRLPVPARSLLLNVISYVRFDKEEERIQPGNEAPLPHHKIISLSSGFLETPEESS